MTDQHTEHQQTEHQLTEHQQVDREPSALGEHATGDIVIDSALQDLQDAPHDDLDRQLEAAARVHTTLQGRLSDLGGA